MRNTSVGIAVWSVVLLSSGLWIGCLDSGGGGGGASGASGAGGTGGVGGVGGSGGSSGAGGPPPIPTAMYEGCSGLSPTYDGSDCTTACSSVRCGCDPFPASYVGCHLERGCLTSVDCAAACERDLSDVVSCIGDFAPCDSDVDCGGGRCVGDGVSLGDCTPGTSGSSCLDRDDCIDGHCVAIGSDGDYRCHDGTRGSSCNTGAHCDSALSCVVSPTSFVGTCSDGALGSSCAASNECQSGFCGRLSDTGSGMCTDGSVSSACFASDQCASNLRCIVIGSSGGSCSAGAAGDPCATVADCNAGDCVEGRFNDRFCTEGLLDQPCADNTDCDAGHCRNRGSGRGICVDGAVGTECDGNDDADCAGGRCSKDNVGAGWTCTAGQLGDRCSKPSHCVVGECTLRSPQDYYGWCTDGANSSACDLDTQCQSNRCAIGGSDTSNDGQCTAGDTSSRCVDDGDCVSMFCAFNSGSGYGQCTEGLLQSACNDSGDCSQGTCAYSTGLGRGECTDGLLGSWCVIPSQCASTHCYTGGNSAGICTTGAPGTDCYRASDCESGSCQNYLCT